MRDNILNYEGDCYETINIESKDFPPIAKSLIKSSNTLYNYINEALCCLPSFVDVVKASVPKESLQAVLSNEQQAQILSGALKLMKSSKDGSLLATLVDTKTNKIVSTIPLKNVKVSPELKSSMNNLAMQMQLAQIAEQIQTVQESIEEVRKGQENDRLAMAFSCQQKLIQAMEIKNQDLKMYALLRIASDAEDSRNLLMQSQSLNVNYIKEEPEGTLKKFLSGSKNEKIATRLTEIKEGLIAINMVSLIEGIAYHEMGETDAACHSLLYYSTYLDNTFFSDKSFIARLDMMDPSKVNYWSDLLPSISEKVKLLTATNERMLLNECT